MGNRGEFGDLLKSARLPCAVTGLELVETHISWVLLAGDHAWKVKKPVRFGFLDFSTPELRRHYCLRELEVNRRFAPGLYLAVDPVRESATGLAIGDGPGDIVDWAVRMHRFDSSRLLDRALERAEVPPEAMDGLAARLADYHTGAPVARPAAGEVFQRIAGPALDNFATFRELGTAGSQASAISLLQAWTGKELERLREWFGARASSGFVRECHGDLHLGNVIWGADGQFTAFDAIEFSDELSRIDVMDDLAFPLMELEQRGLSSHAARLLNRYLELTDDYAGLMGLVFFMIYRAMVRAKVNRLRQAQQMVGDAARESAEAGRYLDCAVGLSRPRQGALWIMHGPSGSGKSVRAMELVERRGFLRLRSDWLRKRLLGLDPLQRPPPEMLEEVYAPAATMATYDALAARAETAVRAGWPVVADGAFLRRADRQRFADLARRLGVEFGILDCDAPADELRQRIAGRGPDPSDATPGVLDRQLREREPLDPKERQQVRT